MTAEQCKAIADKWMEAFNTKNLNQLLSLYSDDAIHFSPKLLVRMPETQGLIKGKEALKEWWNDAFVRLPSLKYQPTKFISESNSVFMEYIRKVENEPDLKVGEVLEFENGLIIASRVYHG